MRTDGVRSLADMMARCNVDDITGCWNWRLAISDNGKPGGSRTPRTSLPAGVIGERAVSISAPRAAWLLSGRKLGAGRGVWRTCLNDECVCPQHLKAGTKAEEGAWMAASGHRRGKPERTAANMRNVAATQALSPEAVRTVERYIATGTKHRDIAAAVGVHAATISKIACGKHMHQRALIRNSSVFSWRP